jgi:hypothetical protein
VPAPPAPVLAPSAAAALAGGLGLLWLTGPALPIAWGALPAAAALLLALGWGRWRASGLRDGMALGPARRTIVAVMIALPMIVLVAVAARTIAAVCMTVPAASLGLAALVVLSALLGRARGVVAIAGALVVAGLAIAATIGGVRLEAAAPGARGFAHTGPILGIHPFQITAISIDGFGPFDLPINDYVEPDGSRGYGPEALAEALQRDLAAIAEQQFSPAVGGPARAYAAFAGARVEAVQLPAIQERLDRPTEPGATEPRLIVWSGTTGTRSRVEFLCPGQANDPRPPPPDDVMDRMCPDKYAAEASAGLGVTGRWTGYTEGRGQATPSLARALGWSQADEGTALWEPRAWAWLVLLLMLPVLRWPGLARGVGRGAAALGGLALAVLGVMFVCTWPSVQVGALADAEPWASPWRPSLWASALVVALLAAVSGLYRRAVAPAAATLAAPVDATLAIVATTWAVAGSLAALPWIRPGGDVRELVLGLGDALHRTTAIDLGAAEAIAGLVIAGGALGLLAALLGPGLRLLPLPSIRWSRSIGLAVLVGAGLFVLSRKTLGGAALLTPALALALAVTSGLALTGAADAAGATADRGRRWLRTADHVLAVLVVLWTAAEAWAERSNPFMAAALVVGVIAALASLVLLWGPSPVRSSDVGASKPSHG